ncbi:MAG: uridine kinase [Bacteroidetes bacterium]|nr:uridine kinase [Bacteroidota bacterium]MDA0874506.1 uridine kinase [Bacteroidota bacterium]
MTRPVIIGLAGGSGSGKSTILHRLLADLGPERVSVLEHDAYYRDQTHLPVEERQRVNYDHPDSLETGLLVSHIEALLDGQSVEKPVYDFTRHTRAERTISIRPTPIIIVEGILVLAETGLTDRMDIKLFVDTDDDIRLIRRIRRDMVERGRTLESILEQYETTVRPMHIEFVEPSKRRADVIIPRGGHNEVAFDMVLSRIRYLSQEHRLEALIRPPAGSGH